MSNLASKKSPEGIPQEIPCPECGREMVYMGIEDHNTFYGNRGEHFWYRHIGKPNHNIRLSLKFFDEGWMDTLRSECARVYETQYDCRPRQALAC